MLVFSKVRELFVDSLRLKLDIEEIKRRLANQDKNLELVFSYLDEHIDVERIFLLWVTKWLQISIFNKASPLDYKHL